MTFDPKIYRWDPTWKVATARFFPMAGAISSTSQYTGATRASKLANSPWMAQLTMPPQPESGWVDIESMLARLDGPSNWIRIFHPLKTYPRGVACGISRGIDDIITNLGTTKFSDNTTFSDGTVFEDGGTQAALARTHNRGEENVLVKGLVASQAQSVMAGDHMEIGGYLYMCIQTVKSDSSGQSLIPIRPALRNDIPVGSQLNYVKFDYATSPFMFASSNYDGFDIDGPNIAKLGLSFVEALL